MAVGSAARGWFVLLVGGVVFGMVPSAHADVCDLIPGVGHLASFGLL